MSQSLSRLSQVLRREDTVIFVGSGVSTWSGLPTWNGLIEMLRNEVSELGRNTRLVEREMANHDLLLAASYACDQLTPQERCAFLKRVFGPIHATSKLHERIVRLGPTCFITTNYDDLLERALRESFPSSRYDVVTPSNSLEIPSLIQARASQFVFKPHGDVSACDTLVLTREDYRLLQGKRRNVFEAMRILLASRPVVFLGFGLRDPDFLLMRDQLFATFDSNPEDHFAIMPDVHPDERQYWRRNYGIELISYEVNSEAPREERHAGLLDLLSLAQSEGEFSESQTAPMDSLVLTLARYARGMAAEVDDAGESFSLRAVAAPSLQTLTRELQLEKSLRGDAASALARYKGHLILEGPPGAGKSHTVRRVAAQLAKSLEDGCIGLEAVNVDQLRVPIVVSMRDYDGDLLGMIERCLPKDVPLESLLGLQIAVILLDGLNEAPVQEDENSLNEQLVRLLTAASENTVIITTRFAAQVAEIELPIALLDAVAKETVSEALNERGLRDDAINPATLDILRRPLFFSAWKAGSIAIGRTQSVQDVYAQLLSGAELEAASQLGLTSEWMECLGTVAFNMIESGNLSASTEDVVALFTVNLPPRVAAAQLIDLLLAEGVFIATPLRKLAFFHHSIAEYFAAHRLGYKLRHGEVGIGELLDKKAWDQVVLISLGSLPEEVAMPILEDLMRIDAPMGLRSLHFVEIERELWISRALQFLNPPSSLADIAVAVALRDLPVAASHQPMLSRLSAESSRTGGVALGLLSVLDSSGPDHAVDELVHGRRGYNFNAGIAEVLSRSVDDSLVDRLVQRLDEVDVSDDDSAKLRDGEEVDPYVAIVSGSSDIISQIPARGVVRRLSSTVSPLTRLALAEGLRYTREPAAVEFIRQEIMASQNYALPVHYFQIAFGRPENEPVPRASPELAQAVVAQLGSKRGRWAMELLVHILGAQPELGSEIKLVGTTELTRALIAYAAGEQGQFYEKLIELAARDHDWSVEPLDALEAVDLSREDVILALLRLRDARLASFVLDAVPLDLFEPSQLAVDLGELDWWLDWLDELISQDYFAGYRLGLFLARASSAQNRKQLLEIFNNAPNRRKLLAEWVLLNVEDISPQDFTDESMDWLVNSVGDLHDEWREGVLARIATEDIVRARLLPLLEASRGTPVHAGLSAVLRQVGNRHGRRYIGYDGEPLR